MFSFFTRKRKIRASPKKLLQARYDAAQTTLENIRHWSMADHFSADRAMSADVRRTLRNRARYEVANNSYAKGMVLTMAGDCVGTGPRLQLQTDDPEFNSQVEHAFEAWSEEVDLASKLRTMRMSKATDGEAFALLVNNPSLEHDVKLDLRLIEADRIASPHFRVDPTALNAVDGVEFDSHGNVTHYFVLKNHPGDLSLTFNDYERISADSMIHWFRCDRPEQHRGVPELTPALPLFAQLRRYTLAVLAAAETAADYAAVLYTDAPANGEAMPLDPMDVIPLTKRMATVLADGWKLGQIKAEQPATTYPEFKREILGEIGRCLSIPINIVTGDSSRHNYASGRLDHQTYFKSLRIEQDHLSLIVMDRIFDAWIQEYFLLHRQHAHSLKANDTSDHTNAQEAQQNLFFLSASATSGSGLLQRRGSVDPAVRLRTWMWDGIEHVDPSKEANAQQTRLASLTTNLANEYARQGKDWEVELRQIAKERALMQELNLTPSVSEKPPDDLEEDEEDTSDDEDSNRR